MALTIEDGTVVAGADSYKSVADTQAYAAAHGLTLPTGAGADAAVEILLREAMTYLESLRDKYQGYKTAKANPLQWPRAGVVIDKYTVDVDEIPACLGEAEMRLACEMYSTSKKPFVNSDGKEVIKERVEGAVEVQYASAGNTAPQPVFAAVEALLAPLLGSSEADGYGVTERA